MQVGRDSGGLCRQLLFSLMMKHLVVELGGASYAQKKRRRGRQLQKHVGKVICLNPTALGYAHCFISSHPTLMATFASFESAAMLFFSYC